MLALLGLGTTNDFKSAKRIQAAIDHLEHFPIDFTHSLRA
jgi:hypothetical protein